MDIGSKITELRKQKSWSQSDLAKRIEVSREIIGRYERNDAIPSIEIAKKLADAFEISLDYLVGKTHLELDHQALKRIEDISKLPDGSKTFIFQMIDMALRDFKAKQAYS